MSTTTTEILALDVPCDSDAPGVVRAAFGRLDSLGTAIGDVKLLSSELVTNAVLHSGCLGNHTLAVRATRTEDRMTISVHDPGLSGQYAVPRAAGERGGWGLSVVVARLAARWGSQRNGGYRVWAELQVA
ncbi:MAG: ATP-binding protein [Solirubrobacteraceae bacterium]